MLSRLNAVGDTKRMIQSDALTVGNSYEVKRAVVVTTKYGACVRVDLQMNDGSLGLLHLPKRYSNVLMEDPVTGEIDPHSRDLPMIANMRMRYDGLKNGFATYTFHIEAGVDVTY